MESDELKLDNHRLIFDYVERNPGTHLRGISRDLKIHLSTLRYHMDYLEEKGLIVGRKEENLKVYFASGRVSQSGKNIAPFLRQKRFRDVIMDIMANPGTTHSGIVDRSGIGASTLSKYLKVLTRRGVVEVERAGRERRYTIADQREVVELLITYKRSFWDGFVDNALEIYFER